jgi:hypothetical protein
LAALREAAADGRLVRAPLGAVFFAAAFLAGGFGAAFRAALPALRAALPAPLPALAALDVGPAFRDDLAARPADPPAALAVFFAVFVRLPAAFRAGLAFFVAAAAALRNPLPGRPARPAAPVADTRSVR